MDYETITVTTKEEIEKLGSALTIEGLRLDSIPDFIKWVEKLTALKNRKVYVITGKTMNTIYKLTGKNAYPKDLNLVSIDLDDMEDSSKVVIPRFTVGGRWLDDIIDNNNYHQHHHK